MKRILTFIFCIALCAPIAAYADDADAARAAVRGATAQSSNQRTTSTNTKTATTTTTRDTARVAVRGTTTNTGRTTNTTARTTSVVARDTAVSRNATPITATRPGAQNISRSATTTQNSARAARTPAANRSGTLSRAAKVGARITGAASTGYKLCRDTYFSCMDEFCANKDAQLKRCACSARVNEFDATRKKLNSLEDKMLDFNERLLAVNMDAEDAIAMNTATEGEKASQTGDESESRKMLDSIMSKLKETSLDTETTNSMAAINLSLDTNVFDSVDSGLGADMVLKSGTELYDAALPTCLEMAAEVCATDEIPMVQNAYTAVIEQDCNVVAKTYAGMTDKVLESVREGGALLEMSRLNNTQTRNSDDILTCKKKMLDALADASVCGTDLSKCLDYSGKYIDPGTGEVMLTINGRVNNLADLSAMITRPTGDEKWAQVGTNRNFVEFLNGKRKYIEPAMKNCEKLESVVWDSFIEDALAKLKLAQGQKLEDMRQSCTTITAECMTNAGNSLMNFDSRALSVFGVSADRNVNEICSQITNACSALINGHESDAYWGNAMADIATAKTLDQITATCREVGQNCIIRNCMNAESKFGLCTSAGGFLRNDILGRNLCWDEVKSCVAAANPTEIAKIANNNYLPSVPGYSGYLYCGGNDLLCKITESIWGRCQVNQESGTLTTQNDIVAGDTLLAWFGENTTMSCLLSECNPGQLLVGGVCRNLGDLSSDVDYCPTGGGNRFNIIGTNTGAGYNNEIAGEWTNCCNSGTFDSYGNCCNSGTNSVSIGNNTNFNLCVSVGNTSSVFIATSSLGETTINPTECVGSACRQMFCTGTLSFSEEDNSVDNYGCLGGNIIITDDNTGVYSQPIDTTGVKLNIRNQYTAVNKQTCEWTGGAWSPTAECNIITGAPNATNNNLKIVIE
jgi:hypothetical protein